ncbi:hypothetical protein DICVIV_08641 [Dictyocaulus viviparus]|uniref:Uncharacterized protein n=1 Tax=Dictyocaulus viviparus TaxID=29172 RepID=A0A0D8XNF8_DICVI|nr:hypothetical protein DICVIV_08641 [Dictyocaulus viviparus]
MINIVYLFLIHVTTAQIKTKFNFGNDAYLTKEYINAITAYGPGLGVYAPYTYVDVSYDNIPFVGKIPVLGKEGTSSKLGISPFYPPLGNPSNPFPPLYRARPLPLHVPEPQDVVAVPLDEEALHGEPLFPPELVLPFQENESADNELNAKPTDPFLSSETLPNNGLVEWPTDKSISSHTEEKGKGVMGKIIVDKVSEKNLKEDEAAAMTPSIDEKPKNPFRFKRIR